MGYLSGDWFVADMHAQKREELLVVRLVQAGATGVKIMLKQKHV